MFATHNKVWQLVTNEKAKIVCDHQKKNMPHNFCQIHNNPNHIVKHGYLLKSGRIAYFLKRYIVLTTRELIYCAPRNNQQDPTKLQFDIKGSLDIAALIQVTKNCGKKKFQIQLATSARSFVLAASNEQEQQDWYDCLQQVAKIATKFQGTTI